MTKSKKPTHCARCEKRLKKHEVEEESGPETWCWACCEAAEKNGEFEGLSTYAVAVMGFSGPALYDDDDEGAL